ncbi:MAG: DUF4823 domain-containing protein [Pedosphaera sp.]|nr:DUF4823 domain-containing protein [Pedosphaera sp.]
MKFLPRLVSCAAAAAALLTTSCRSTVRETTTSEITGARLNAKSAVYVGIPANAPGRKGPVLNSGQKAAELVRDAFGKCARQAWIGRKMEVFDDALETARNIRAQFLVYPTLIRWEDRATGWNGLPDKAEIKIQIADCATGDIIHSSIIKATGPTMSSGDETPAEILIEPVSKYAASLFQKVHTPTALPKSSRP